MPLIVHFLNVGAGDCTIIEFPHGRIGMVDIDNLRSFDPDTKKEILEEYHDSIDYLVKKAAADITGFKTNIDEEFLKTQEETLTDPLAYFDAHIGKGKDIFRLLITHPDMDHMTGLHRLVKQEKKTVWNFWHTGDNDFNLADAKSSEWFRFDQRDWEVYKEFRGSAAQPKSLQHYQGQTGDFWTEDGVEIWAPTPSLEKLAIEKCKANILSMVLRISYKGRSIVLGGDATAEETWPEIYKQVKLHHIDVLKASHHGRKTGYYQPAVEIMSPWLTITSVGQREHDATSNYRRYSAQTVSLRKSGDIRIRIDDDGTLYYPSSIEPHWKSKTT